MTRGEMAHRVMKRRGHPKTRHTRVAYMTMAQSEGGDAENNMLNTTQDWEGATNYNWVGVKNYRTEEDGVEATAKTFDSKGHGYERIEKLLKEDAPAKKIVEAWTESDWGTSKKLAVEVWRMIISVPGMLRIMERKQVAS
jgi:hypothetical protein